VLVAQVIALLEIAPLHQVVKNNDPQSELGDLKLQFDFKTFALAAVEETMRR